NHFAGEPPAVFPRQGGVAQVDVVAALDGELQFAGILVAGKLAQLDAAVAFGMSRRHDIQQQSGRQRIEIAVQLQTDPAGDVIDAEAGGQVQIPGSVVPSHVHVDGTAFLVVVVTYHAVGVEQRYVVQPQPDHHGKHQNADQEPGPELSVPRWNTVVLLHCFTSGSGP